MKIETKYNVGDNVFTIDMTSMKVKSFNVHSIGVSVSKENKVSVTLYEDNGSYSFNSYDETKCFPSETELLDYVTKKDVEPVKK